MAAWQEFLSLGLDAAASNIRVTLKTNLGPAVVVYDGRAEQGATLADYLGIKFAVTVQSADGATIAQYGEPPATEPLRIAVLALIAATLALVFVNGLRK